MSSRAHHNFIAILLLAVGCHGNVDGTEGTVHPGPDPTGGSGGAAQGGGGQPGGGSGPGVTTGGGSGGGTTGGGGSGGPASCGVGALPAEIQALLGPRCQLCHGNPPVPTVPGSLMRTDDFSRPAKSNP